MEPEIPYISIDDFAKLDIRICKVLNAEFIIGADKLLKLTLDEGTENPRIVLSGIREAYPDPNVLIGRSVPVIVNLAPRTMKGEVSNGMMLAPSDAEGKAVLLCPLAEVAPGTKVK